MGFLMNLQKHPSLLLSGRSYPKAFKPSQKDKAVVSQTMRRRPCPSVSARPDMNKPATKPRSRDDSRMFLSFGRSSDPRFGETASTKSPDEIPKSNEYLSESPNVVGSTNSSTKRQRLPPYRNAATKTNGWLGPTSTTWDEDDVTDLQGGGERRTDANDDDDDGYDDEEEGISQSGFEARGQGDIQSEKEIARAEHCARMEIIARETATKELVGYLKDRGFFNYNYNTHARTSGPSKANLKTGKKRAVIRLLQLLSYAT